MLVSIIIINYNTFQLTCQCIESVFKHTHDVPFEVVVVDNASPNDEPDEFKRRFPEIVLVKSNENGGFSKGNNLGIAHSKGDIILLLNSDTYLTEDSISLSANHFKTVAGLGAMTVKLVYPDGRLQHTARKFRTIRNELLDFCRPLLKILPYRKRSEVMLNQYFNGDYNTYCDWVSGAYFMISRSTLSLLPDKKLDERFFMYGEDQLWCWQLVQLGLKNYYYSGTTVVHIHKGSSSNEKIKAESEKLFRLELQLYQLRHTSKLSQLIFKVVYGFKNQLITSVKMLKR